MTLVSAFPFLLGVIAGALGVALATDFFQGRR